MPQALMSLELGHPKCPMCAQTFASGGTRARHLALCCPDLIDPVGWRRGDERVVRRCASLRHPKSSFRWAVLSRRFGWSDDDGGADGGGGKDADIADAAFPPEDAISEQILEEQAKDQALEDAMDYLDEALGAKKIELEPYLEFIRELSKEQFFARATTMVTRKAQRERGRSQGVTF